MVEEALAEYDQAVQLSAGAVFAVAYRASLQARTGDPAEARRILTELTGRAECGEPINAYVAGIYDALGETDRALGFLEAAYQGRESRSTSA